MTAAILLVEDDALIRMMLAEMVVELGHRVVAEAGTVREAMPLAEKADYDIALLDVDLNGEIITPVAEAVARRGLPFVLVSGHRKDGMPSQFRGAPMLEKPFLSPKLEEAIEAALGPRFGTFRESKAV